jgi:molybdopterin-dependent oxidoreductase-like protein protein/pentapeptide repeat protein
MLADALRLRILLVLSADGEPLSEARGGPLRVVVPSRYFYSRYFYKSLKWLERIELLRDDKLGFWERTASYHNTADPWRQQRYVAAGVTKAEARAILENRDISGRDLRSLDAEGRDLTGLVARGALLRDADFRRCRVQGACFDGANLTNAHFGGADLRAATFRNADLEGADFSGANLGGACLLGASLIASSFFDESNTCENSATAAMLDRCTQIEWTALEDLTPEQQAFLQAALDQAAAQPDGTG